MKPQISNTKWWPWLGWFIVCIGGLYQFVLQISISVMIPGLSQSFAVDGFVVSLLSSSFFYIYLICQMPAGMVVDYFKPRKVVFISQMGLALGCFLFANSPNLTIAYASRVLMGFVSAPTFVCIFYLIATTLPSRYFALVAGLTETMAMLGGVAGQALLARCVMWFGWRHTMMILSGIACCLAILAVSVIRDEPKKESDKHAASQNMLSNLITMLKMPQAWINGLYAGLTFGLIAAFSGFWCIPYMMELYHITLARAADVSSMMFLGAATGTPLIGWLSDRMGTRRILMMSCALFAAIVLIFVLYFPPIQLAWMFLLLYLLGLFSAAYLLPFAVIRDITSPDIRGTAMGYINMMCIIIGSPILQPLIGWLLHVHGAVHLHNYREALTVLPICLIAAFGLAWFASV